MLGISAGLGQRADGVVIQNCFSDLGMTLPEWISAVSGTSSYKGDLSFVIVLCLLSVPSDRRLLTEVAGVFLEVSWVTF